MFNILSLIHELIDSMASHHSEGGSAYEEHVFAVPLPVVGDDVNVEQIEETLKVEIESLKRKLHRRDYRIVWLEE